MKSLPFLFMLFSAVLSGQKFSDELNSEFESGVCECLGNSPQKTLNTVGQCIDNWTNKYGAKFNEYIDFNSKTEPQKQFDAIATEFIRQNIENLTVNCDGIANIMENLRAQLYEADKKNYETLDLNELNKNVKADRSALLTRAKYYFYHQDLEEAGSDFQEILKSNPNDEKALYFLGRINESEKNYQEAIEYYRQLIKITGDETYKSDIYLVKRKIKNLSGN